VLGVAAAGDAEDEAEDAPARFYALAAAGEAEDEDEDAPARFDALAAATAAGCLGVVTGVPLWCKASLAAQIKTRWASRISLRIMGSLRPRPQTSRQLSTRPSSTTMYS
jgi:hypothetical protein